MSQKKYLSTEFDTRSKIYQLDWINFLESSSYIVLIQTETKKEYRMFTITDKKFYWLLFKVSSAMFILAIVTCFICELAIDKKLNWSLYVLCSCIFTWMVVSPAMLFKRRKFPMAMAVITVLLLPYLMLIARITPNGNWFYPLALPIGLIGIAALWVVYLFIRHININRWYKSSALVTMGTILYIVINIFANIYLDEHLLTISDIISILACGTVAVLLYLIGVGKIPDTRTKTELIRTEDLKQEDKGKST